MMASATPLSESVTINDVLARLKKVRQSGPHQWEACCPAHEDRNASLSVSAGEDGRILQKCHAGCSIAAICEAEGITVASLFADKRDTTPRQLPRRIVDTYDYADEQDTLLYQAVRYMPKDFKQRRPDGQGGWIWNIQGVRRVPFRLPQIIADTSGELVIFEGEKDAQRGAILGLNATTTVMGAGNFKSTAEEMKKAATGRRVYVVKDADDAGDIYAADVQVLKPVAKAVYPITLPRLTHRPKHGEDFSDWLDKHGGSIGELRELMEKALHSGYEHENNENDELRAREDNSSNSSNSCSYLTSSYPDPLKPAAYYGLAGDIVNAIAPHTEADPAALLSQLLVSFGNAAGRNAFAVAEASNHFPNLYVALVGNTAKGRKGSSWAHVLNCMRQIDGEWSDKHVASGLSSGEGLIHMLRDTPPGSDMSDTEPLLADKRLLVHQGEFASVLKMMARDGNTLSDTLRLAWDGVPLRVLTKQTPERATNTHLSLIGHITRNELLRYLTATDAANGFGNRFLWVCVTRSQRLPDGGDMEALERALKPLAKRLNDALSHVRGAGTKLVTRDPDARALWHENYARLSDGLPGLLGAMLARAEAQVMRLSMIYALLDCSHIVRKAHLEAALALWEYTEASARYIFGDALGDPDADTILSSLRRAGDTGMTRTEISALFGRNKSATELNRALQLLAEERLAYATSETTSGRAAERWRYGAPMARTEAS